MQVKDQEVRGFQSEVKQLLHLMIHSLYSNKEIFLRELISNASDAADKLRFLALSDPDLYEGDGELRVRLWFDKDLRTLTISDNGIGMLREEVIDHLGTIAKSGTKQFLASIGSSEQRDQQLIGQFGVGFYSAFIVADKVTVCTRAAGTPVEQGVLWESSGEGEYTVANITKQQRGTEITLHLREGEQEFLDDWRLRTIIGKYSDHIALPVELQTKKSQTDETDETDEIDQIEQADQVEQKAAEITWESINKAQALWTRNKTDISDEEYCSFYKHVSHDFTDPLVWSHNRVEGKQQHTTLLYIPAKAPWDLWNRDRKQGLKLYVQRVFIMDDAEQFMPSYLRFVRGIIDSNDLPLNISREILQDNRVTRSLRSACTKRVLQMLEKLASDDAAKYQQFWNEFGAVMKEGVAEDFSNREAVSALLRFSSTHADDAATAEARSSKVVSLDDYLQRMPEEQEKIYYLTADGYTAANSSPHLALFRKKNWEVLLLCDRIDEWMMNHLTEFKGKSFQLITKADVDLGKLTEQDDQTYKELESELAPLVERVKNLLGDRVKTVRLTQRLIDTPAAVTTESDAMSTQMAKLLAAAGQKAPEVKYNLELNPTHSMVRRLTDITDEDQFADWTEMLLAQALLAEQGSLEDPNGFVQRLNRLLTVA